MDLLSFRHVPFYKCPESYSALCACNRRGCRKRWPYACFHPVCRHLVV